MWDDYGFFQPPPLFTRTTLQQSQENNNCSVASSTFPRDIVLIVRCEGSWVTGLTCDLFFKETRDCVGTHIWDEIRRAVTNSVTSRGDPFSAYVLVDIDSVGVAACNR